MNRRGLAWSDLRTVLAIARAGSLAGAARAAGVNHATMYRRLNAIEARIATRLFQRRREGYAPTAAGEALAATARRIETEIIEAERRLAGQDLQLSGTLRITTTDTLFAGLLSPLMAVFRARHPRIALEFAISNRLFNLSRRDADIAVRPGKAPDERLIGRRAGTIEQAVYIAADAAPVADRLSPNHDWIGPDRHLGYAALEHWFDVHGLAAACVYRVDTLGAMQAAAAAGAGPAVLPCYLGEADPRLRRLGAPIAAMATDLWILTHADLRRVARVRAFNDFVFDAVRARLAPIPRAE